MRLNLPSKHRRSMSTQRQKPIDFAAEGLCLASLSIPTAESRFITSNRSLDSKFLFFGLFQVAHETILVFDLVEPERRKVPGLPRLNFRRDQGQLIAFPSLNKLAAEFRWCLDPNRVLIAGSARESHGIGNVEAVGVPPRLRNIRCRREDGLDSVGFAARWSEGRKGS